MALVFPLRCEQVVIQLMLLLSILALGHLASTQQPMMNISMHSEPMNLVRPCFMASWGQAGLQGVAMIYGLAVWVGCHHNIWSSLGIVINIVIGQARVLVSPKYRVWPECGCHHCIWSSQGVAVTRVYGLARVWVSPWIWLGQGMGVTIVYGQARV